MGFIIYLLIKGAWYFAIPGFLLIILLFVKKRRIQLIFLILGIFSSCIISNVKPNYNDEQTSYTGYIYERKENYFLFVSNSKRYYVYQKEHEFEILDKVKIEGVSKKLSFSSMEGQFNFKEYLFNKEVERELSIYQISLIRKNPLRINKYKKWFANKFDIDGQLMMNYMFLSKKDEDIGSTLSFLNLYSLFSLTGIHLYALYSLMEKIGNRFCYKKKKTVPIICILLLVPLVILNGSSLASIKVLLLMVNSKILKGKFTKNVVLSSLLLLTLIFNPHFIYTSSFVYIFLFSFIVKFVESSIKAFNDNYQFFIRIIIYQIIFGVLCMFYQGQYNLLSLIYYPIFLILTQILFSIGFLCIYHLPFKFLFNLFSKIIIQLTSFLSKIDTNVYCEKENYLLLIILGLLLFLILYLNEILCFKRALKTGMGMLIVLGLFVSPLDTYSSDYVCFINVGQGDCALIHYKNKNVLIDTGGSNYVDVSSDVLIPFLKRKHIYYLDCVFISHTDSDHSGALASLSKNFRVNQVVLGSNFYEETIGKIKFKNLNTYYQGTDENINSSVIYFSLDNTHFLFMGDAPKSVEEKIINDYPNINVDILKVGHHGSNTSTSIQFIKTINPKEAVISVAENNRYGHPNDETLNILLSFDVKIRRTDLEGSIIYKLR